MSGWLPNCNQDYRRLSTQGLVQSLLERLRLVRERLVLAIRLAIADRIYGLVPEKRYTKEHEWIELSEDGKTGSQTAPLFPVHTQNQWPDNCYR